MRRANAFGEGEHVFGHAHLEIHAGLQDVLEQQDIALLNVSVVLTQVNGDAVGACLFGVQGSLDRVR